MTTYLSLLNTGDGILNWAAGIVFPPDPPVYSNVSIPVFEGVLGQSDVPASAGLDPAIFGVSGNPDQVQSLGLRGEIAFGYDARTLDKFFDFDVENHEGSQVPVGSANPLPDFVSGMAFPRGETDFAYAVVYNSSVLYEIDRATGFPSTVGTLTGSLPGSFNDITVDPTTGIFYGTGDDELYIIDPVGLTSTFLGAHINSNLMIGIACDAAGDLWGYDIGNDVFYSINKNTGLATAIGSIGYSANFAQSMFYDETTDNILLAAYSGGGVNSIRVADRATGNTVAISSGSVTEMTASALPVSGGGGPTGGWLTLDTYSGVVTPGGGTVNIGTNFDATGTSVGEVYTADIDFDYAKHPCPVDSR